MFQNFPKGFFALIFWLSFLITSAQSKASILIYDIRLEGYGMAPSKIQVESGVNIRLKFYNFDPCIKIFKSKDLSRFYLPHGHNKSIRMDDPSLKQEHAKDESMVTVYIPEGDDSGMIRNHIDLQPLIPGEYSFSIQSGNNIARSYLVVQENRKKALG